ncbi:MAG: anti-anti-sigma factor [Paraglaciecola sp.]|jgi:anti-anti-sigma factor
MSKQTEQNVAISRRRIIGDSPIVVTEIFDDCLYTGFYGVLDSSRVKKVIEKIMSGIERDDHDLLLVDLSNVEVIDSTIAGLLSKMSKTLELVGVKTIISGINPSVAQSIVNAGVDMSDFFIVKNLKRALQEAYRTKGLELCKIEK